MNIHTVISHYGVAVLLQDKEGNQSTHCVPRNSGFVVGDEVRIEGNKLKRLTRRNELARKTPFSPRQVMAANLDGLGIVVCSHPQTPSHFIDSAIVAARVAHITPFIIVNKCDLLDAKAFMHHMTSTYDRHCTVIATSAKDENGITPLAQHMKQLGRCMLVGLSGAGKSSLTNLLVPEANVQIGKTLEEGEHGRHTTSASSLLLLPQGGELIDTPGVRDFKPADITKQALADYFVGFEEFLKEGCRFRNCLHIQEPGCAILEALREELLSAERYEIYKELLESAGNWSLSKRPALVKS